MGGGSELTKKQAMLVFLICMLFVLLSFLVFRLMNPVTISNDWTPVNVALEVMLTEDELSINAELDYNQEQPMNEFPVATGQLVLVNVNRAAANELETLPGIGPAKAKAIIAHREEYGFFKSIESLLDVNGIGPATFEKLKELVTIN